VPTIEAFVVGALLGCHGIATMVMYLVKPSEFPWDTRRSWLLSRGGASEETMAKLAVSLSVGGGVALGAAGLGVWGVPVLLGLWDVFALVGAAGSLAVLTLYFNYRLTAGVAINLAVLMAVIFYAQHVEEFLHL
jgi:hypothetical protein